MNMHTSSLSLLDRLVNDAEEHRPGQSRTLHNGGLTHAGLRRDLENLLNSRSRVKSPPARHPNLQQSLLAYGLRDLVTVNLVDAQSRRLFAEEVQSLIRRFEPRLTRVQVSFPQQPHTAATSLRFRIEALVRQGPALEPIIFNSILEPGSCSVRIEDAFYV